MEATRPRFTISINNKDITSDLTKYVGRVSYTDRVAAESDEAEIVLNNADGRFTNNWYFSKGDQLDIALGYDADLVDVGTFTIDQIEASGPPDTVTVRAIAAGSNSPLRTRRSAAHEGKTLAQIARTIADAQGFTIEDGTASTSRIKQDFTAERSALTTTSQEINRAIATLNVPNSITAALLRYQPTLNAADSLTAKGRSEEGREIRQTIDLWRNAWIYKQYPDLLKSIGIARDFANRLTAIAASLKDIDQTITRSKLDTVIQWHTQDQETDLQYLTRIAKAYGILFSVRGTVMVFTSVYDIEGAPVADTIRKGDVTRYTFTDKAVKNYAGVRVIWHDTEKGEIVEAYMEAPAPDTAGGAPQPRSADVLEIRTRVENQAQADEVAKAHLHQHSSKELECTITIQGRPLLCAGVNVTLADFGVFDGKWACTESQHTIDTGSGYVTELSLKRGR